MDMVVMTLPGHVRDYLGQWVAEYDAAVARPFPADPESHEQSLMQQARLLGTASAIIRIIQGAALTGDQVGPADPAGLDPAWGADPLAIPANRISERHQPGFDSFTPQPAQP